MNATTFAPTTAEQLVKGNDVRITTASGEIIEGTFVSLTARGIRINSTPVLERSKYVTRKLSVVMLVEVAVEAEGPGAEGDNPPAELAEPATGEATVFAELAPAAAPAVLTDAAVDDEFAALIAHSTEFGHGLTQIEQEVEAEAAAQAAPAAAPAAESNEDGPEADHDTNPLVNGKPLSEMRFPEVMELAKKYKTPGRGVARIDALRAGVALAISQEAGRLASAN